LLAARGDEVPCEGASKLARQRRQQAAALQTACGALNVFHLVESI